ncbi:hypothetical protein TrLO_g12423 [Triparma laevis f. longispina]|uniref:Uncharacterized protein n=1 Tax=Triparma laevis f. longispina TaxID=1714387 RepID=A0A9W7A155_9STRA|nr:hypothetical protein TrLO_g12423 [Triparma laevis f. longispina]
MSKYVATESNDDQWSRKINGEKGAGDEGNENGEGIPEVPPTESLPISTVVCTVPATIDQFMFTPEFRRHFVEFVSVDTLMMLRFVTKGYRDAADAFTDGGVRSGELMVHAGNNLSEEENWDRDWRRKLITRIIFLLNITKVGENACYSARNLVIVDIPEGVESIGHQAFCMCQSLTTVSFPTTLTWIGCWTFAVCRSLENVDLLHTNLQALGYAAFGNCTELKSMTIPDSLQSYGEKVFHGCSKLVPSNLDVGGFMDLPAVPDATSEVIAHLRSLQSPPPPPPPFTLQEFSTDSCIIF